MKRSALFKKLISGAVAAFLSTFAFAEFNSAGIPDSTQVRGQIVSSWLKAPLGSLREKIPQVFANESDKRFQVSLEEDYSSFIVAVVPQSYLEVTVIGSGATRVERQASYTRGSAGTWLLYRSKADSTPQKIEIYFNNNREVYLILRPSSGKTFADMVAYGSYLARSVPLGLPFERCYTASFQEIFSLTRKSLPWQKVLPDPSQCSVAREMMEIIRDYLPYIDYGKYAAYNEKNELYSIRTGKPYDWSLEDDSLAEWDKEYQKSVVPTESGRLVLDAPGFVKWVIDGMLFPVTGHGSRIMELVQPTVLYASLGKKGVQSQKWNLTLNLDWVRNAAVQVLNARSVRNNYTFKTGGVDVTVEPFVSTLSKDGKLEKSVGYIKDVGYQVEGLKSLFYVLGVTEPSYFYIGAVRHSSSASAEDSVFDSSAVFFPYFDEQGRYYCSVFQSGKEFSIEQFAAQNPGAFVHLERVRTAERFEPLKPAAAEAD